MPSDDIAWLFRFWKGGKLGHVIMLPSPGHKCTQILAGLIRGPARIRTAILGGLLMHPIQEIANVRSVNLIDVDPGGTPSQEISGNGTFYSYASASLMQKAYLQSIFGQLLLSEFGLLADPIATVQVPEPNSLAILGMSVLLIIRRSRRV